MCTRVTGKKVILIPESISWEKKSVLRNYSKGFGLIIKEIPYDCKTGKIVISELKKYLNTDVASVYIETPNFFGIFEDDIEKISNLVKKTNALFVVGIDPISLGIIKNPGDFCADIVVGEGRGALREDVDKWVKHQRKIVKKQGNRRKQSKRYK